jgi:arginine decarboxylase
LTVNISRLGITGYEADEILHQELGVTAELPLLNHLTFIISLGNSGADIDRLINAFTILASRYYLSKASSPQSYPYSLPSLSSISCISPRDAFFTAKKTVKLTDSIGCISAETICPYPPGIPVIMLGEIITRPAVEYLRRILNLGSVLIGCSDSSLETIETISIE